ncbi:Penicillin-binding protein 1A [Trichormus variabilis ATCC 29413]|uniref:Penicillin-binding protein 1A n=2 Tax=Anabaena variabilis TaxID=264691 RepID=Q3MEL2_TRIV2|nr:penicillin-binding protein 1A [Trichormus variabilis]ABA20574.1 Penicillin-binding protein 1A [Trichormus variabilis ATCC 29413]MBC1213997.1 penicillin-binding protein 1A [Trichormus variabilis ARAD]MBC1255219.1 penicillin-binding protein 1A [Trichormus variabilis V5]MBC1268565.1 penicillin-binding protein 1A [Trichormus variabilis FSR]MBC1300783.1 penicillin-binding protein 1A [Trichormus variabilis N2B]MBC1326367.1 penicillin-binding protein 1A [Trichormus variabilis 9RC]MBD2380532.1 pe
MPPSNRYEQEETTNENLPPTQVVRQRKLLNQISGITSGIVTRFTSRERPIYRRVWFWAGLSVGGGIIAFNYLLGEIDKTLPDKAELQAVVREQTITIKAVDGTILQQQGEATREKVNLEKMPEILKKAFIASEDSRFSQHQGIDPQGIVRAAVNNLRSQNVVEGGSTITQQLSRILFLKQERTVWRKLKEVRLAQKLEQELTKDQILERYLNLVYLGAGAYGVADAAWVYFSKPVDQLTLPEAATIAGMPPAPSLFSPDKNPEAAKQRRNLVLQRMEKEGFITPAQRQEATQAAITLKPSLPKRLQVESPYFTSYIQQELPKYVSPQVLANGGLTVETSLNPTWQQAAEAAVAKTLRNQGRWQNFKQAALVAIDPRNGEIKAMVGGQDFGKNQFNRVTQAQRQPGSTFKGFVYATAIATGKNPYDTYVDAPLVVDGYEPKNYGETFRGTMNMRDALTRSVNVVALKVMLDVGFEPTIQLAKNMGIKSKLNPHYSLALGSNEVNLLELTSAYGSFATQGLHSEPHGIRRILNRKGEVIWSAKFDSKRVLDPTSAAIMTWMLRNVVEAGTGAAAQLPNRPVAGKTGTSDEARDLWFIGYIPQVVTGVWLGNDNNRPTYGSSGSAAYTWHEFMEKAVEGMPIAKFPERPKLEGRKGSIKAKPIKAKQILNRPLTPNEESVQETGSSTRRRRRSQRLEETTPTDSPRRRRRYRSQESVSSGSEESPRRRRRRAVVESDTSEPTRRSRRSSSTVDNSSGSASSAPTPSWRERLRPKSSSSN